MLYTNGFRATILACVASDRAVAGVGLGALLRNRPNAKVRDSRRSLAGDAAVMCGATLLGLGEGARDFVILMWPPSRQRFITKAACTTSDCGPGAFLTGASATP